MMMGMLDIFTVTFFGHRQLTDHFAIEERLDDLLRELITTKEYVEFLVGRDGEFDLLASSAVRRAAQKYGQGNTHLTLVLPYDRADYWDNRESFEDYYDEVEICGASASAHFKAAITIRNRELVDRSDLVVCAIEHKSGGAYRAVKYAQDCGKTVVNLCLNE